MKQIRSIGQQCRKKEVLLQICSHIASGAKHFKVEAKHHTSVSDTKKRGGGGLSSGVFSSPIFNSPIFGGPIPQRLFVELQGQAATDLGATIFVLKLATKVLGYWKAHLDLQ